jgi:uncharacterized protein YecE (DUF72 family)
MDFGYLPDISTVDFRLPPDHPDTLAQLHYSARDVSRPPVFYIGAPQWVNKSWLGNLYPANAKEKDFLYHYARQFNTIELNSTHYGIPSEATISRWREAVTPEFKFCPKFPQLISHEKQLVGAEDLTTAFCDAILGLEENLGVSFLQLPPTFGPKSLPILEKFILSLPEVLPLAIEFRHPDWFSDFEAGREAFALLEACRVGTVFTDVASRRDVLHMRLTTPTVLLRFNGYKLQPSDYTRVDAWVKRFKIWFQEGLQTVYFFMHQHHAENIPPLVLYLIERLATVCHLDMSYLCKPLPQEIQGKLF